MIGACLGCGTCKYFLTFLNMELTGSTVAVGTRVASSVWISGHHLGAVASSRWVSFIAAGVTPGLWIW